MTPGLRGVTGQVAASCPPPATRSYQLMAATAAHNTEPSLWLQTAFIGGQAGAYNGETTRLTTGHVGGGGGGAGSVGPLGGAPVGRPF